MKFGNFLNERKEKTGLQRTTKRGSVFSSIGIIIFLMLQIVLAVPSVFAEVSISLSPSGELPYVNTVDVEFLYTFSEGYQTEPSNIEDFNVKMNGKNVTQEFMKFAEITYPSATEIKATIKYLFSTGTYKVSTTVDLEGEDPVSATTTFTVPGDEQERRKTSTLNKISEFIHLWDDYTFGQWIVIGDLNVFQDILYDDEVQIYIDPGKLGDAVAMYIELEYVGTKKYHYTTYERDFVLATEPENIQSAMPMQPIWDKNCSVLWHEAIHAISHDLQLKNDPKQFSFNDDHLYIEWAESAIGGLSQLVSFEKFAEQVHGATTPSENDSAKLRAYWKNFVTKATKEGWQNPAAGQDFVVPTAAQKEELKTMIGFDVDPAKIRANYESLGYPSEYFEELPTVSLISPAADLETTEDRIEVTANYTNNNPDLEVVAAGFIVNANVQLTTISDNSFSSTIDLVDGNNMIQAGIVLKDGRYFLSPMITIKKSDSPTSGLLYDFSHINGVTVGLPGLGVEVYTYKTGETTQETGGGSYSGSGSISTLENSFSGTSGSQRVYMYTINTTMNTSGDTLESVDVVEEVWDSPQKNILYSRESGTFSSIPISYASPDKSYFIYAVYGEDTCSHITAYSEETFSASGDKLTEVKDGKITCDIATSLTVTFTSTP